MAKQSIQFHIVTPERKIYSNEVLEVTVPTGTGYLTILPNHIPLVSTVVTGELRAKLSDGTVHPFAVSSGILEVQPSSKVVILADRSELATEIDLGRAEEAYKRAEEAMKASHDEADVDYARFESLMEKELNRVQIAKRWK
jgi:F-type H+-transporting ATPase subunit epsilon